MLELGRTDQRAGARRLVAVLATARHAPCAPACSPRAALAAVEHDDDPSSTAPSSSRRVLREQILPVIEGLLPAITAGADDLYARTPDHLG